MKLKQFLTIQITAEPPTPKNPDPHLSYQLPTTEKLHKMDNFYTKLHNSIVWFITNGGKHRNFKSKHKKI